MSQTLTLVACVKTRQQQPAPASEFYTSPWFRLARDFARQQGPWLILTAKHGVLRPSEIVEPHEECLVNLGRDEREAWAKDTATKILQRTQPGDTIIVLAGVRYRQHLVARLKAAGRRVEIPMGGLRAGEQLQWLRAQLQGAGQQPQRMTPSGSPRPHSTKTPNQSRRPLRETRLQDLRRFYGLLDQLRLGLDGGKLLSETSGMDGGPKRGICFLFEPGESRTDSGHGPRVVYVGTPQVSDGGEGTLGLCLNQQRGLQDGAGDHRASDLRKQVGASIAQREPALAVPSWGQRGTVSQQAARQERALELRVCQTLATMSRLWLDVDDEAGQPSLGRFIMQNSIALLSNFHGSDPLDGASEHWLGLHCPSAAIRQSHLWNSRHGDEEYDPAFLLVFEQLLYLQLPPKFSSEATYLPAPRKLRRGY